MKRQAVALVTLVALAALTGCTVTSTAAPVTTKAPEVNEESAITKELDALYEAAIAAGETSVVVYGTVGGDRKLVYDAFQQRYPKITVQLEQIVGADLYTRVNQEVASGNMLGDVIATAQSATASLIEADRYEPYVPVTAETMDEQYIIDGGKAIALGGTPFGVAVNTDLTSIKDAPKTWDDLLNPEYKGKMTWVDMTIPAPSSTIVAHLMYSDLINESWLTDLKAQEINFTPSSSMGVPLASGEREILIAYPYDYFLADKKKGVPVDFSLYDDENYVAMSYSGILRNAAHPNAAKLLTTWLYTEEAAQAQAAIGQFSFIPDAPAVEGLPPLSEIEVFPSIPFAEYDATMKSTLGILKGIFS